MTRVPRRNAPALWLPVGTAVCLLVWIASLAAQTGRTQERDMFVTVLNEAGDPAMDLAPGDFVVWENGMGREVLRARRATDPIDLTILIDNSQAASPAMLDLRRALERFTGTMREHGRVALVSVADRPTIVSESTSDDALLKKGIGRLFAQPGSGATVLEALSEVLKGLGKRDAERAALVVIWLGGPEFSTVGQLSVLEDLKAGGAALHVLTLGSGVPADTRTTEGRDREVVFDQGSRETGGQRRIILSSMALADALDKLATELTSQYRITYARPDTLIPPDKVEVKVKVPGLTARGTPVRVVKKAPAVS